MGLSRPIRFGIPDGTLADATMPCLFCGRENRAGRKFCAHCGTKLTLICTSCGAQNEPGEQFRGECGKQLAEPSKPAAPPGSRSYTPPHRADRILAEQAAMEARGAHHGERKMITLEPFVEIGVPLRAALVAKDLDQ